MAKENQRILSEYIAAVDKEARSLHLDPERQERLEALASYIRSHPDDGKLLFVCTHNSRRSQLSQVWGQVLAHYYKLDGIRAYSAGTEVTAFHINTLEPLKLYGMRVTEQKNEETPTNPLYTISFQLNDEPERTMLGFSKLIADPANPAEGFCAVMTCGSADKGCPYVAGATKRISLPFVDPKGSDGTPQQDEAYRSASHQIAVELAYAYLKATSSQ